MAVDHFRLDCRLIKPLDICYLNFLKMSEAEKTGGVADSVCDSASEIMKSYTNSSE